jgi:hypothetical protein
MQDGNGEHASSVQSDASPEIGASDSQQLNEAALAKLAAWVPALGLYRCRPTRQGFEAVATWRESTRGRKKEDRNRNLKIMSDGIRDRGTGQDYTPIDLVMAARKCDLEKASAFLSTLLLDIPTPADAVVAPEPSEPVFRLTHSPSNSPEIHSNSPETSGGAPAVGPAVDVDIRDAEMASVQPEDNIEKEHLTRTLWTPCSSASARVKELFVGKAVDAVAIAASLLAERFLLPNGWCNLEYKPQGDYFVTKVNGRRVHLTDSEISRFVSEACERHSRCWCGTVEVYRTLAWMCYRGAFAVQPEQRARSYRRGDRCCQATRGDKLAKKLVDYILPKGSVTRRELQQHIKGRPNTREVADILRPYIEVGEIVETANGYTAPTQIGRPPAAKSVKPNIDGNGKLPDPGTG